MIKSFKIFEAKAIKTPPNFIAGDKVVCINDTGFTFLKIGEIYTISEISIDEEYKYWCSIIGHHDTISCTRFLSLIDYELNKYNL